MAFATLSALTPIVLTPPDFAASPVDRQLRIYGSDSSCLCHTYVMQAGARRSGHHKDQKTRSVLWEAVNMQANEKTKEVRKPFKRERKAKTLGRPVRKGRNTWKLRREKLVLKKRQAIFNSRPGAPYNSTEYLITQYSSDTGESSLPAAPCFYC